jgi:hypothetical protein
MGFPSFRGEDLGVVAVEDGGGQAASEAVVAVGSFEVVEAQPRLQVGVDVVGVFVEAVAEGAAVVEMQAADISTASSISRIHRFAAGIVGDLLVGESWSSDGHSWYMCPNDEHEGRGQAIRKGREAGLEAARLQTTRLPSIPTPSSTASSTAQRARRC